MPHHGRGHGVVVMPLLSLALDAADGLGLVGRGWPPRMVPLGPVFLFRGQINPNSPFLHVFEFLSGI